MWFTVKGLRCWHLWPHRLGSSHWYRIAENQATLAPETIVTGLAALTMKSESLKLKSERKRVISRSQEKVVVLWARCSLYVPCS